MPLQPAFVLHARPYRETSQLVELFSAEASRLSLVARGSRTARSPLKGVLQPFMPLSVSWRGTGELKNLDQVEACGPLIALPGERLFSGLYLNELLYYLLERHTPFPELFSYYRHRITSYNVCYTKLLRWQPGWLPAGFSLVSSDRHQLALIDRMVDYLLISDGLVDVSIYLMPTDNGRALPNQLVRQGATSLLTYRNDHKVEVTVVGEIPAETARRIAESLQSQVPQVKGTVP